MNPFRSIRQAPISVCLIWVACTLFVGVYFDTTEDPDSRRFALRQWGAGLEMNMYISKTADSQYEQVTGFSGPTDVWDGEWWRLLVSNLHHVGFIHLLMNGCAMIYLGRIIERRMPAMLYLYLLIGSAFTVAAVSGLVGELGIGLSGVAYAQVGFLMVWRDRDESVADEFTIRAVLVSGLWLMFCQVITYADIYPIGNVAHYTGLIYGWIWGQVYLEVRQRGIFQFLFGVSHLLLYPAFWFILNPFWDGSWHWYQSQERELALREARQQSDNFGQTGFHPTIIKPHLKQDDGDGRRRKVERLQTALLLEPSLELGWVEISEIYENSRDRRLALRTALEGLKHNRGSEKLLNRAVELWVDDERFSENSNVPVIIEQVFGSEAEIWKEKLSSRVVPERNRLAWQPDDLSKLLGVPQLFSLSNILKQFSRERVEPVEDRPETPDGDVRQQIPEFDPCQPDSAREGNVF